MAEAELLVARGRLPEAKKRWLEAAHLEAAAFEQIPQDRGKTRGIIAVSAVALFRDAGAFDEAFRLADEYLTTGDLPDAWQAELAALVRRTELQEALSPYGTASVTERRARDELMALLTQYAGVEPTQETCDEFLIELTAEVGALPDLGEVVKAVRLANSIEVTKVGNAVRHMFRSRRPHSSSAVVADSSGGVPRPPDPNLDGQRTAPSTPAPDASPHG